MCTCMHAAGHNSITCDHSSLESEQEPDWLQNAFLELNNKEVVGLEYVVSSPVVLDDDPNPTVPISLTLPYP